MKTQHYLFIIICLLMFSCKKISPEAPDFSQSLKKVEKERSFISIPIELPVKLIEDKINENFKGLVYDDDSYTKPTADDIKIKVWIKDRIQLRAVNEIIQYTIPLKIWGQGRWKACDFCPELEKQTAFDVDVYLKTEIKVLKNYKINSTTLSDGFTWKSTPKISFGPFNISIASIVEKAISDQLSNITKEIDYNINKQADLSNQINDIWMLTQVPYLIDEESNTWLSIEPLAFYLSPVTSSKDLIHININFESIIDTQYGGRPKPKSPKKLPELQFTDRKSEDFTVNISSSLSFYDAGVLAGMSVKGMELNYKNKKIFIKDIEIFGKGDLAYIRVAFEGNAKGQIYLFGKPKFDSKTNIFYFENLDYDIKSRNLLLKTANWLANDLIRKKLSEQLRFSFEEEIVAMRTGISEMLKEYKHEDLFVLRGNLKAFQVNDIIVAEDRFDILLYADGNAKVVLTNLGF
jgi:hypothetical protein